MHAQCFSQGDNSFPMVNADRFHAKAGERQCTGNSMDLVYGAFHITDQRHQMLAREF